MDDGCHTPPDIAALVWLNTVTVCTDRWQNWWLDWSVIIPVSLPHASSSLAVAWATMPGQDVMIFLQMSNLKVSKNAPRLRFSAWCCCSSTLGTCPPCWSTRGVVQSCGAVGLHRMV